MYVVCWRSKHIPSSRLALKAAKSALAAARSSAIVLYSANERTGQTQQLECTSSMYCITCVNAWRYLLGSFQCEQTAHRISRHIHDKEEGPTYSEYKIFWGFCRFRSTTDTWVKWKHKVRVNGIYNVHLEVLAQCSDFLYFRSDSHMAQIENKRDCLCLHNITMKTRPWQNT